MIKLGIGLLAVAVLASGCVTAGGVTGDEQFMVKVVHVGNRDVPCVVWISPGAKASGMQCDFR